MTGVTPGRSTVIVLFAVAVLLTVAGLHASVAGAEHVEDITIDTTDHLHVDQSAPLTVWATQENETVNVTDDATVTVSNETVLTYENASLVAASPGTANVTATVENESTTISVTVVPPVTDLVAVWDRSLLPLRVEGDDADYLVDNQWVYFDAPDGEQVSANRHTLPMFSPGTVTLDYRPRTGASTHQEWPEEHVIVVGGSVAPDSASSVEPADFASLDGEALQSLNEEVQFEAVTVDQLDGAGRLATDHDVGTGQHVAIMFTIDNPDEPTITVTDGDIVFHGETTVIGADGFVVHDHQSTVTIDWPTHGIPASVAVETDFDGDVDHLVAIYERDAFLDSTMLLNITDHPDDGISSDDLVIEQDIGGITGSLSWHPDHTVLGLTPDEHSVVWPVTTTNIVGLIAAEATYDGVETLHGDLILEASIADEFGVTASTTVAVETDPSWTATDYDWIHVASNDSEVLSTTVGSIETSPTTSIDLELEDTVHAGETAPATVLAELEDNSTEEVTDWTTFETNDSTVATVTNGTLEAHDSGWVIVTATFGDHEDQQTVRVDPERPSYQLSIPNDGGHHVLGIPGPAAGSLESSFPNGTSGVTIVYRHDGGDWIHVTDFANETPDPLTAYVLSTTGDGPAEIPLEVTFEIDEQAESRTVDRGWQVLPAPAYGDAEDAFGATGALLVLDRFGVPTAESHPAVDSFSSYVVGSHTWGVDVPSISPFGGYFVYFPSETTIHPTVTSVSNADEADDLLGLSDTN